MADWGGGGRKWWLIRSPRLTFSIASFLLHVNLSTCKLVNLSTCQERVESFNLKHFISQSILSWVPPDRLKIFAVDIHRLHLCYVLSVILFVFVFVFCVRCYVLSVILFVFVFCVFCFLLCFISHTYFLCLCFVFSVMFYQSWFLCLCFLFSVMFYQSYLLFVFVFCHV